jgi:hypothetical protein
MTKQTAEYILEHSDLLIKSNCKIVDDVLYERLSDAHLDEFFRHNCDIFRFFISTDHYDYVEDDAAVARLHQLFK